MSRVAFEAHTVRVLGLGEEFLRRRGADSEVVPLRRSHGRVLAEEIRASVDLPLFSNSQMDGFAVRAADVRAGVRLPVSADIPAGSTGSLAPGGAARIMTGAPVPEGADAIVPVEWTDVPTGPVPVPAAITVNEVPAAMRADDGTLRAGTFVRPRGDDIRAGDTVIDAGTRLGARHLGVLGSLGVPELRVRRRVRVAVLSTGSELVPPGERLAPGQIWESNSTMLAALAAGAGDAEVVAVGAAVADRPEAVAAEVDRLAAEADLLLTSGGVSAGAFDETKAVLRTRPGMWFGSIAMQPGGPQGAGLLARPEGSSTIVLALPGNPVSAAVSFEAFARPLLALLYGRRFVRRIARLPAAAGFRSPEGKLQFARGRAADGSFHPLGGPGSHLVAHLAAADALALVPPETSSVAAGEELECWMLDD